MPKRVTVSLVEGMRFNVNTGRHELTIDASSDVGGSDTGPSPMDLQLAALAGCASMDVVSILRKMRADVTAYAVEATGDQATEHPQRYTGIVMSHSVTGNGIDEANVRRAIYLSMSRYCPVFAMLSPSVPITVRYEMFDAAGAAVANGVVRLDEEQPAVPRAN